MITEHFTLFKKIKYFMCLYFLLSRHLMGFRQRVDSWTLLLIPPRRHADRLTCFVMTWWPYKIIYYIILTKMLIAFVSRRLDVNCGRTYIIFFTREFFLRNLKSLWLDYTVRSFYRSIHFITEVNLKFLLIFL